MILVDTSVWVDHFRMPNRILIGLLDREQVLVHHFILGELACGNLKNRKEIIALLHALPSAQNIDDDELLFFIERHRLMGRGIGLIDMHLLASCLIEAASLWTIDRRLKTIAWELKIGFD